ncbi:hypothetical protein TWF106_011575 [Orbilia oligospora]|uniref:F-box domain-containing protein n=1 Tax=Orbilia oligospora TaxID=2813651 RepID=A0A7C8UEI1_ORBOL|nr:hypothetical protein TWF106_011575 [Orbilia oligospora]
MLTKSPNSPYFLRSFNKLSTAAPKSDPDAPEYIGRPKPSLDYMPLEILLEIAFYLPDARTAVQLSCVSSLLYWKLAGSQYFWYRFGNQVLKKFQKFSQTYNYHGYIVNVMSGGIKSTCQICLTPKRGIVRKGIGKVVCMICLDENIVRADVVRQISNIDLTNLQEFEAIFYLDGEPDSRISRLPWHKRSCYWLPAVKREATKAYNLPWGEVMAKHQDVRPLASPQQIREYYNKVHEKIFDETTSKFRQELGRSFKGILEPDAFRGMLRREQCRITAGLSVPTEGQNDQADDAWVGATALRLYVAYFGTQVSISQPAQVRMYRAGRLWGLISMTLLNRLTSGGKYRGGCTFCPNQLHVHYGNYLGATEFLEHVAHYHPEKVLNLKHSWDV